MYLWWRLCTLYLLACQARVGIGGLGLCCVRVASFERCLTPPFLDFVFSLVFPDAGSFRILSTKRGDALFAFATATATTWTRWNICVRCAKDWATLSSPSSRIYPLYKVRGECVLSVTTLSSPSSRIYPLYNVRGECVLSVTTLSPLILYLPTLQREGWVCPFCNNSVIPHPVFSHSTVWGVSVSIVDNFINIDCWTQNGSAHGVLCDF